MEWIAQVPDDEMIAAFLQAEVDSKRFGPTVRAILDQLGGTLAVLRAPDATNPDQKQVRRRLLAAFRGYERGNLLFRGFPSDVAWWRIRLDPDDLLATRYCSHEEWTYLSGGTRKVADGAAAVLAGDSSENAVLVREIVRALESGASPAPLIFVATSKAGPLVALEGHKRLTAYGVLGEQSPDAFDAYAGVSPEMGAWAFF